jgi:hypothetical protein
VDGSAGRRGDPRRGAGSDEPGGIEEAFGPPIDLQARGDTKVTERSLSPSVTETIPSSIGIP